ncbi:PadR family transcriptional regulator [Nocardia terpenica]|uniref:Transcription regulator PadR N-terminal domain-containing protein n=1 Tax=Nocardia terpenica TaxID=455432 RepID=A0A6G9Z7C0_9NOCA|nr:hypothetical protein F6W96_27345 [Nocardia terpenica]
MGSLSGSAMLDCGLLLLLAERPDHGYSLRDRLEKFGLHIHDEPGVLYRRLHVLERRGLIEHCLHRSSRGPTRKVYSATAVGMAELDNQASSLRDTFGIIRQWLIAHSDLIADDVDR